MPPALFLTIPVQADYDGDGKDDLCVYELASGNWFILKSSDGTLVVRDWGYNLTVPIVPQHQINRFLGLVL